MGNSIQKGNPSPAIQFIHHLKFPVADLEKSMSFYEQVFGAKLLTNITHKDRQGKIYAQVLQIENFQPMLELWINAEAAKAQAKYDFITLAVKDRAALSTWMTFLDELGIEHSEILTAIDSWLVVFEDPDGHRLRLYSLEEHEVTEHTSKDERWLDKI